MRGALSGALVAVAVSSAEADPPAAHVYTFADRSSVGDPSSILGSAAVAGANPGEASFAIAAGGAATLPGAANIGGAYVEWRIVDINGAPATIHSADIRQFWAWLSELNSLLPTDTYMGIAVTAGGVATIGNSGLFAGIRFNAGGNIAFLQGNAGAGAGWASETVAGAADLLTRGLRPECMAGSTFGSALRQVIPLDASGKRSSTASTTITVPAASNIMTDGGFTHIALVVGRSGAGGGAATIVAGMRSFATEIDQLVDYEPVVDRVAPVQAAIPRRFLILGESNAVSVDVTPNPTWSSAAVQAGWVYRHNGVTSATYPATNSPGVGCIPFVIEAAIALGATSGNRYVIRRGTSSVDTNYPGTMVGQVSGAIADVTALGLGDPDLIILIWGANDDNTQAAADGYPLNMRRTIKILRHEYPNATIAIWRERTTDDGAHPFLVSDIYDHQDDVAAAFDNCFVVDSRTVPAAALTDTIHFSAANGGGQQVMGERTLTLYVAAG